MSSHFHALGHFTPGKKPPGTHSISYMDPRAGLNCVEKRKILPLQGIKPWVSSPLLYRLLHIEYTLCLEIRMQYSSVISATASYCTLILPLLTYWQSYCSRTSLLLVMKSSRNYHRLWASTPFFFHSLIRLSVPSYFAPAAWFPGSSTSQNIQSFSLTMKEALF
jgi:hypothetical protein